MGYPHYGPCIEQEHIEDQREWSDATFGPGQRTKGVIEHIRRELVEVEAEPDDPSEWADLLILVIDGATRRGITARQLIHAYRDKMRVNMAREWPDWREFSEDEAIEHVRAAGSTEPLDGAS